MEEDQDRDETKNGILEKTANTFKWWNNLSTLNAEDPFWIGGLKILVRLFGILILLALSPLVLLGMLFAIIGAA